MTSDHSADEEATAYHEAGHAIVGALCDRAPCWVTIIAADGASGKTQFPDDWLPEYNRHLGDPPKRRAYIETRMLVVVAGTIAHDLRFPERAHDEGDEYDDGRACKIIAESGWVDDGYLQQLKERASNLLRTNWPWVEAVARALIERKTLQREEVMQLRPSE